MWCVNWTHVIGHLTKLLQMQLATSKNFQERLMTNWLVGRKASKLSHVYHFRPPLQFWNPNFIFIFFFALWCTPCLSFNVWRQSHVPTCFQSVAWPLSFTQIVWRSFPQNFPKSWTRCFFLFFSPKREDFFTTNLEAFGLPYRATTSTIPGVGDSAKTTNQWGWIVRIFSKNKDVLWTWTNLGRALHTHDEVWVLFLRTSTQRPCSMLGTILANPGEDFSVENRDFFAMAFGRPHLISWKTYLLSTEWDGPNDDSLLSKKRLWQCPTHATETWNELLWRKS